jgi:hypothetical protein
MAVSKIDFNCPSCGKKNRVKIKNIYSNEDITNILNRDIFKIECTKCNKTTILDYPFTYVDDEHIIYYNMEDTIEDNKIKRTCKTFDDIKEKILIFNDNLNDIIIEYIKLFIESELKIENVFSEVRYDSFINNELRFYVINKKEYANIDYSFYENLITKGKLKKVKDAAVIDANTCLKYFHL